MYIRDLSLNFLYVLIHANTEQMAKMKDEALVFIKMIVNKISERNTISMVIAGSDDAFDPKTVACEDKYK